MRNNRSPPLSRTENFSISTALADVSPAEFVAAAVSRCKIYPRGRTSRWRFGPLLYLLVALVSATVPAVSQSGTQTQFSTVFVILTVGTLSLQIPKPMTPSECVTFGEEYLRLVAKEVPNDARKFSYSCLHCCPVDGGYDFSITLQDKGF
jgi:hypothetical protein